MPDSKSRLLPANLLPSEKLKELIKKELVTIYADGSILLHQEFFNYATGLRMIREQLWEQLFGVGTRKPSHELTQDHCNLALAIQTVTEEIVLRMAAHIKELTGSENLCLAGGVALNCVANGKLQKANYFKNLFIQPAAGDAARRERE